MSLVGTATAIGGSGLIGKTTGIVNDTVGKLKDTVEDTGKKIGGALGFGPGIEKVKGVPDGFPESAPSGPTAGFAFKHADFDGTSLELKPGLYNYDDLNGAGLHDQISSIRVKEGYQVVLFKGVEGGKPAGDAKVVTGPKEVTNFKTLGYNDQVSSIAVRKIPEQNQGSVAQGNPSDSSGSSPTSAGGSGRTMFFLVVAGVLLYVANQ